MYSKTDHITIIEEIARGLSVSGNNDKYLELGIAKAKCFNRVAKHFRSSVAVDINISALNNVIDSNAMKFLGNTDTFFKNNNSKYDLIFIDANHDYASVFLDFDNAYQCLSDNGIIILHDTYPPSEEYKQHCKDSYKIDKYLSSQGFEHITLPVFFGLTIVKKGFSIA